MKQGVSLSALGHSTSFFLAITYALCVAFGLVFPQYAMYPAWQHLLPGFEWLGWKSFLLGLIETYGYGWFFALVWGPLYNVFALRKTLP